VTVHELVERERGRLARATTARGGALATASVALVLAAAIALLGDARWLDLPPLIPFIVWALAIGAAAAGIVLTVAWLRRYATRVAVARTIERERALRAGALQGALEVEHTGALGRRGAADLVARLKGKALAPATQKSAGRRALAGALTAAFGIAACVALAQWSPDGWSAMLHPVRAWRGTLLPRLVIDAPADVLRGERTTVRVTAPGRHRVAVYSRTRGAEWAARWYPVNDEGSARLAVGPMDADVALVAADGRATSDTVLVRVSDKPFVGGIALRAIYPAYLQRADEALPAGEVARVPVGTRIAINGRASTELSSVSLVRGADTSRLGVTGHRFEGSLRANLGASGHYAWRATGTEGVIADLPSPLELEVVPDSAPKIEIVSPARDTIVVPTDHIQLALLASDDHGLSTIAVRTWRASTNGTAWSNSPMMSETITLPTPAQWSGSSVLDLSQRGLGQGDALHVVAVATDNSPWHQTGMSRELILRVPSVSEQRTLARSTADSAAAAASSIAQAQRSLEQRTNDASRARGQRNGSPQTAPRQQQANGGTSNSASGQQSLSYASAEQAKALAQEQRQLADRVKSLEQQAKQLEQQLKQSGSLDSGLANELHQAQQLLRDALTPELKAQLDKLDQSAQSLQSGDARQTLGDLAREQQKLREQLERTVDVLKRAALEGSMQTLHDEAKDLAHRDSALSQRPQQSRGQQQQGQQGQQGQQSTNANEAKELADRSRDLSHAMDSLSKRLSREKAETGAKGVSEAQPHVDASAQDLDRAAGMQPQPGAQQQPGTQQRPGQPQQSQQGAQQPGQQAAQQAAQEMGQAAQQLSDARSAQIGEWKSATTSELDRSIQETLQMARQEQSLAQQAQQGSSDASSLKSDQSAIQQGVDQANARLQKAGRQSALISGNAQRAVGEARAKVQQATGELQANSSMSGSQPGGQTGSGQQAAGAMRDAADALNQAAAALVRDRERANQATSASGLAEMLQQMQALAQQQGQLNSQSQGLSLMPGANGQPSAEAQALAERQRRVAQSLDAVGGGDASGRADALAKEAREIAAALARSGPDPSTISRQQRLYHRLLDAGHTLEQDERDSTGKRQAQSAVDRPGFAPGTTPVEGKSASKFREPTWNELRGLSAEERQLVIDYFKRINAQQ
jgi:hypothetical protein